MRNTTMVLFAYVVVIVVCTSSDRIWPIISLSPRINTSGSKSSLLWRKRAVLRFQPKMKWCVKQQLLFGQLSVVDSVLLERWKTLHNRAAFTAEFSQGSKTKMPLPPSELTAMATAASSRARGRLNAVPSAGSGDDALEEALSALGDFIELAINKV